VEGTTIVWMVTGSARENRRCRVIVSPGRLVRLLMVADSSLPALSDTAPPAGMVPSPVRSTVPSGLVMLVSLSAFVPSLAMVPTTTPLE
jgi:hypothetical protein